MAQDLRGEERGPRDGVALDRADADGGKRGAARRSVRPTDDDRVAATAQLERDGKPGEAAADDK
jgi:hypothetical protein